MSLLFRDLALIFLRVKKMAIDKIICVGKNYLDHAIELGDRVPEKPVLFLKPASVLKQALHWGEQLNVYFPSEDTAVQPECEIALRVARDGFNLTLEEARESIAAVTLGLDMTLRTRQTQLKAQGHPWTISKVFMDAAILGPWIPYNSFENYLDTEFKLIIDDYICQCARGREMRMQPEELLCYISQFFPLKTGDIIFMGTPAGVTTVQRGITAELRWGQYHYRVRWE